MRHALRPAADDREGRKAAQGRLSLRRRNKERAPRPRLLQSRDGLRGKGASQAVRGRASFKPCDAGPCGFLCQTRLFPPDGRKQADFRLRRGEGTGDRDRRAGLRGASRDGALGYFTCALRQGTAGVRGIGREILLPDGGLQYGLRGSESRRKRRAGIRLRAAARPEDFTAQSGQDGETWCMLKWLDKEYPEFEPVYMGFALE